MKSYLGADPGQKGGLTNIIDHRDGSSHIAHFRLEDATEADIKDWLRSYELPNYAVLERVSSSPQMGVVSSFTFGRGYGFLRGLLVALEIPFVEVTPQKWQKPFGIGKSDSQAEHKRKLKAKAQQLYPNEKVTLWNADALLLATFCRQNVSNLF